jgi:hypothetical protein
VGELDGVKRRMLDAGERGLRIFLEDVAGEGQRGAPVREGTLRASAEVEIERGLDSVEGEVSFNTVYAARQHEETDWEHPLGGEAKFLERPFVERLPRYRATLEAAMRRAL